MLLNSFRIRWNIEKCLSFFIKKRFRPKESHFKLKLSYFQLEKTRRDFLEKFSDFNQFS